MAYQMWVIRKQRAKLAITTFRLMGAEAFANILVTRGVGLTCDDCGNVMTPDMAIDIITRDDGSTYVGHRSHNRRGDWGVRP